MTTGYKNPAVCGVNIDQTNYPALNMGVMEKYRCKVGNLNVHRVVLAY
jgi:hypothetical protein